MRKKLGKQMTYILIIFVLVILILAFASVKLKEKAFIQKNTSKYYWGIYTDENNEEMEELEMNVDEYALFLAKKDFYSRGSFLEQFYDTLKDMFALDFGNVRAYGEHGGSWETDVLVRDEVLKAFPKTLMILCASQIVIIIGGVLIGLKSIRPKSILGKIVGYLGPVSSGIPAWWIAGILVFVFAFHYKIFPVSGYKTLPPKLGVAYYFDILYHMVLPVASLVLTSIWGFAYICRNIALKEMEEEYVTTARAKGLPEKKILHRHVLKASAPGITTMATYSLLEFISSCLVVEIIFSWKGLGNLLYNSFQLIWTGDSVVLHTDVNSFMGACFFIVLLYLVSFIIMELVYSTDPRMQVVK